MNLQHPQPPHDQDDGRDDDRAHERALEFRGYVAWQRDLQQQRLERRWIQRLMARGRRLAHTRG